MLVCRADGIRKISLILLLDHFNVEGLIVFADICGDVEWPTWNVNQNQLSLISILAWNPLIAVHVKYSIYLAGQTGSPNDDVFSNPNKDWEWSQISRGIPVNPGPLDQLK